MPLPTRQVASLVLRRGFASSAAAGGSAAAASAGTSFGTEVALGSVLGLVLGVAWLIPARSQVARIDDFNAKLTKTKVAGKA